MQEKEEIIWYKEQLVFDDLEGELAEGVKHFLLIGGEQLLSHTLVALTQCFGVRCHLLPFGVVVLGETEERIL